MEIICQLSEFDLTWKYHIYIKTCVEIWHDIFRYIKFIILILGMGVEPDMYIWRWKLIHYTLRLRLGEFIQQEFMYICLFKL